MLIPLSTDRPPKRRPIVNETIVLLNLLVYLVGVAGFQFDWFERDAVAAWGHFSASEFRAWQLITYQFIHDPYGVLHVIVNMVFLWVFGNAVESRLGRFGYATFYLVGGALAALANAAVNPGSSVIGASGSVAVVSGAFLALFPRARIRVLMIFLIIGIIELPATWFILFYFVVDLMRQGSEALGVAEGNVAYAAHLAGYVFGFGVCFLLLATRRLERQEMDIFYLFQQMKRRREFRAANAASSRVWEVPKPDTAEQMSRRVEAEPLAAPQRTHAAERAEISRLLAAHDVAAAADKYRLLLSMAPESIMPERSQMDLANHFFEQGDLALASRAYELLLRAFPGSRDGDQVRLILAMIYTRRLRNASRAKELIGQIRLRLAGDRDRELAESLLAELNT